MDSNGCRGGFIRKAGVLALLGVAMTNSACSADGPHSDAMGAQDRPGANQCATGSCDLPIPDVVSKEPGDITTPWRDGEDCRPWGCAEGYILQSIVGPSNLAQTCTAGPECASGFCVDGVCCDNACTGTCFSCSAAKKGLGADGTCGPIVLYGDPDNECPAGACNGAGTCKLYNGAACTTTNACLSGHCVDGFCCGNDCTGTCRACSVEKRGGGYNGQCGAIAVGTDPDSECNGGVCNGNGTCSMIGNGGACSANGNCASGFCADGVCCDNACTDACMACSAAKKGQGADGTCGPSVAGSNPNNKCISGVCNGSGTCKRYNGNPCTSTTECLSAYCVDGLCCGNACTGTCMACTAEKRGGGFNGQCGPIVAGTDPDDECGISTCNGTGACIQLDDGFACTKSSECVSGHCADGVCCNSGCPGTCNACSAVKKGQGADGTCGPIAIGNDPDSECTLGSCTGASACGMDNGVSCNWMVTCLSGHCVDGVCCDNACSGVCMACTAANTGVGIDGQCAPIAPGTDPNNECSPGACNGTGACELIALGEACTDNSSCSSGFCVDGVCCDNACIDSCHACTIAKKGSGTDGQCGPIAASTDPDNECPNNDCNGAGACTTLPNGSPCNGNGECASGFCIDGVCCGSACNGICTDLGSDSANCGACGHACVPANDEACVAGICENIAWASWPMPNPSSTGLPNPASYTIDGANETVIDNVTHLMWQRTVDPGSYTWTNAKAYCDNLTHAGYTNWRLPSRIELLSLFDFTKSSGAAIDSNAFPNTPTQVFWTSSQHAAEVSQAWGAKFMSGSNNSYWNGQNKANANRVRCVR